MIVYTLIQQGYEEGELVGVFATREEADRQAKRLGADGLVEEWAVGRHRLGPSTRVMVQYNGVVVYHENSYREPGVSFMPRGLNRDYHLECVVGTEDPDEAVRVAEEKRKAIIEAGTWGKSNE